MEPFIIYNVVVAILVNEMVYEHCSSMKQMAFVLFGTWLNNVNSKLLLYKCSFFPPHHLVFFLIRLKIDCWVALFFPLFPFPPKMEERKCCPCTRFSFTYYGVAKPWFPKRRSPICCNGKNLNGRSMQKNAKAWLSPTLERYVLVLIHSETEPSSFQFVHQTSNRTFSFKYSFLSFE